MLETQENFGGKEVTTEDGFLLLPNPLLIPIQPIHFLSTLEIKESLKQNYASQQEKFRILGWNPKVFALLQVMDHRTYGYVNKTSSEDEVGNYLYTYRLTGFSTDSIVDSQVTKAVKNLRGFEKNGRIKVHDFRLGIPS